MNNKLKLISAQGIEIYLHSTFPLILVWAAIHFGLQTDQHLTGAFFGIAVVVLLFLFVVVHELGHALAARHYGAPSYQIVILPIGGITRFKHDHEKPKAEFFITLAGPVLSIGATVLLGIGMALLNIEFFTSPKELITISAISVPAVFSFVFLANILLTIFGLLPAFPLDGGRLLRSLLAMQYSYTQATGIAVKVGQGLAIALGIAAIFNSSIFMFLVALVIVFACGREKKAIESQSTLLDGSQPGMTEMLNRR